jgi:subtilisin family serine protease
MYEVNITEEGYIVGISDSGIDMTHCHFYDPEHAVPYDTVNMQHRKMIYYNKYVPYSEGHGTHVSSTVAGRSYLDYGRLQVTLLSFPLPPSLSLPLMTSQLLQWKRLPSINRLFWSRKCCIGKE